MPFLTHRQMLEKSLVESDPEVAAIMVSEARVPAQLAYTRPNSSLRFEKIALRSVLLTI